MTANTATARMATKTQYLHTGSKEAFFCSLKIVTATAATVKKTGALYVIYTVYTAKTVKPATVNTLFMCL